MPTAVTDLHYVALAVPDLASERSFFGETWGLMPSDRAVASAGRLVTVGQR